MCLMENGTREVQDRMLHVIRTLHIQQSFQNSILFSSSDFRSMYFNQKSKLHLKIIQKHTQPTYIQFRNDKYSIEWTNQTILGTDIGHQI